MLRVAAGLALVVGVGFLLAFLHVLGKGPFASLEQRHLRAMKDRTTAPVTIEAYDFERMAALPNGLSVAEYSAIERRAVSVEGYVQRIVRAPDGDYHLDFAPETYGNQGPLVPFFAAEITPEWHLGSRTWRYEPLTVMFRSVFGLETRWDQPPRRVRLSGWLMCDYEYEGAKPVFGFPEHLTHWEIHPVTRIEAWDDSLAAFVDVPR